MRQAHELFVPFLLGVAILGCASKKLNIGDDKSTASLGQSLTDYAGTWDGYAEAYKFLDGSDHVRLTLDAHGEGTIKTGAATSVPKADPDHDYPDASNENFNGSPGGMTLGLYPGFEFPIADGQVQSNRIQLTTSTAEFYREWCELMQPQPTDAGDGGGVGGVGAAGAKGDHACLPGSGVREEIVDRQADSPQLSCRAFAPSRSSDADPVVDCGKANCLGFCACDADRCTLASAKQDVDFDAALESDGHTLVGTLVFDDRRAVDNRPVIRLTRQ